MKRRDFLKSFAAVPIVGLMTSALVEASPMPDILTVLHAEIDNYDFIDSIDFFGYQLICRYKDWYCSDLIDKNDIHLLPGVYLKKANAILRRMAMSA